MGDLTPNEKKIKELVELELNIRENKSMIKDILEELIISTTRIITIIKAEINNLEKENKNDKKHT